MANYWKLLLMGGLLLLGVGLLIWLIPKHYHKLYIRVYLTSSDRVIRLSLEQYLVGVVLAEMPGSFNPEALKAQAVCARTYCLKRHYAKPAHPKQAVLCDDSRHCQAYIPPEKYNRAGVRNKLIVNKVKQAVEQTRGQVLTWEGELIDPVYHSTCGGHTESAKMVWGHDFPYLRGVSCSWDSSSPYYHQVQHISAQRVREVLDLEDNNLQPVIISLTKNGRVANINIGGRVFTGTEFRAKLDLPSTWLEIKEGKDQLIITTHGYGHGVGMCQYGANGMARKGAGYQQILYYYYPGTKLYKLQY